MIKITMTRCRVCVCLLIFPACGDLCPDTPACLVQGACRYDADRDRCVPADDADCARSTGCRDDGACQIVAGTCQALDAAQCTASEACTALGRCQYQRIDGSAICIVGKMLSQYCHDRSDNGSAEDDVVPCTRDLVCVEPGDAYYKEWKDMKYLDCWGYCASTCQQNAQLCGSSKVCDKSYLMGGCSHVCDYLAYDIGTAAWKSLLTAPAKCPAGMECMDRYMTIVLPLSDAMRAVYCVPVAR